MPDPNRLSHVRHPVAWVIVAFLVLLTLLAFSGVADNGFINYDDGDYLTANPVVAQGLTARGIAWAFTTTHSTNWHPLTWLSHMLDAELFGMHPSAHHLVGLALHAANTALVFLALFKMTGAPWRSALVAALFAVHPLHVESVAWAAERKDLLSTLFVLFALLAYVRSVRRAGVASLAVPALLLLALLAKPMAVSFPLLLLLLDWWPLGRWSPGSGPRVAVPSGSRLSRFLPPASLWLEKAPLFLLAATSSAITLAVQNQGGATAFGSTLPLARRAANAVLAYGFYLRKAVVPTDLAVFYPYSPEAPAWWVWSGWLAILAAITVLAVRGGRTRPYFLVGWLWFLGVLVPTIGIVQVGGQAWADRYTYLPLAGFFLGAVWAFGEIAAARPRLRPVVAVGACVALLACLALTRVQVAWWRDSLTLYRHTIGATDDNWVVWNLLGNAYAERNEPDQAIAAYRTARRLAVERGSRSTSVEFNLAAALQSRGDVGEAAEVYRDVLKRRPADREVLNNLGNLEFEAGNRAVAVSLYHRALDASPDFAAGHFNLARALWAQGDLQGAERHLREVIAIDPQDAGAAALLRQVRRQEDARGVRQERQP